MNQKERMLASRPYFCDDALNAEQAECREKLARLRAVSDFDKSGEREALIREILGAAGARRLFVRSSARRAKIRT